MENTNSLKVIAEVSAFMKCNFKSMGKNLSNISMIYHTSNFSDSVYCCYILPHWFIVCIHHLSHYYIAIEQTSHDIVKYLLFCRYKFHSNVFLKNNPYNKDCRGSANCVWENSEIRQINTSHCSSQPGCAALQELLLSLRRAEPTHEPHLRVSGKCECPLPYTALPSF